jgi:putative ABC transport system permease protein
MDHISKISPPKWPVKLLRLFLKKQYLEEIEGDMEEIFYDNVEHFSVKKARQMYSLEMLKLMRPILIRNLNFLEKINHYAMLKNYFKVSIRGLMKNPLNTFINVFGLSAAIGICVFGFGFARWTFRVDQFHEHKNEVHLVTFFADRDGKSQEYGKTPRPLGEMLREDFAYIKKVCRVEDRAVVMKQDNNVYHERVRMTDPEFLQMFTFPLKWGTASSLNDPNSIILSEPMAEKYFGDDNPIGQTMLMIVGTDRNKAFKVTGVAAEFPKSRTITFDFLVNFENVKTVEPNYDFANWNEFVNATFIQVDKPSDLASIRKGMDKYKEIQNKAVQQDWAITKFDFASLANLHIRSEEIRDDISRSSKTNYTSIYFMAGIAVFMLALACFNYMNIAIATATKRLKEIGVRKSIGASRRVVIFQFLAENVVVIFFALIIGVILGRTFFIAGFESLWNFNMDFKFADPLLWTFLAVLLLFTSVASGIYPSLYISRISIVGILKGSVKFDDRNMLTKIFLCLQLIFACMFITMSVMFAQNTTYLTERSWGYDPEEILYARAPDKLAYEKLRAKMSQVPDVVSISGSTHHVAKSNAITILHFPDRELEVDQLAVDPTYFKTMGLEIIEGRGFNDHDGADKQSVVINEKMAKTMLWDNPIGQAFMIDSVKYEVVGMLRDFHNYSFAKGVRPMIFTVADKDNYRYLSLRTRDGAAIKTYTSLQENWISLFPELPFDGGFQEDAWGFYWQEIEIYKLVWRVFAFFAVTLAALGLYGLIRLNVAGRTKEFSIRKVLGAGIANLSTSITNRYLWLLIVSIAIGGPVGFILAKWVISTSYEYHMPITFSGVSISIVILIIVFFLPMITQIRKVLKTNPVEGLKVE